MGIEKIYVENKCMLKKKYILKKDYQHACPTTRYGDIVCFDHVVRMHVFGKHFFSL